ncbi:hypothetical protein GCM10022407_05670 [Hymenobacter antarcticus]|uniref:Uncharacterized protein n=1 Tax=Hymenobacter antarcticus TaxID=486270 RepID=A0ABP7P8S1_9BACT
MVLLASVLKPVDDTRMHGKFARTLSSRLGTRVHVAGRAAGPAGAVGSATGVQQHPIFSGSRLSLTRLAAQWRYWRLLQRLRPALVIVHAPELLPLTMLWQIVGRQRQFLYDIRENYALNVSTQQVYRGRTRRWLAAGLRWVETLAARRAGGLLLAEASYASELPFLHEQPANRVLVLENKYQPAEGEALRSQPQPLPPPAEPLRLLYSGTISELNGVWEAIDLARGLHAAWPGGAHLTIIGFCQQPALLAQLEAVVARHPVWLTLIGGGQAVSHRHIVAEISRSHVGLLPYRPHPSTERCRPTKLFEYLAHGLPVVASPNALWQELLSRHGAGLSLDFTRPEAGAMLAARLRGTVFYPQGVPGDVLWEPEGKKLWLLLDSLFKTATFAPHFAPIAHR